MQIKELKSFKNSHILFNFISNWTRDSVKINAYAMQSGRFSESSYSEASRFYVKWLVNLEILD